MQYEPGYQQSIKTPILTTIYNVVGVLWVGAAGLLAVVAALQPNNLAAGIGVAAVALFMGLASFGLAQVVMLIAKIEFNTRANDSSYEIVKLLSEIVRNTTTQKPNPDEKEA